MGFDSVCVVSMIGLSSTGELSIIPRDGNSTGVTSSMLSLLF